MVFEHIISLGFYCDVAMAIESLGYRDASYPLDWCISKDWIGIEKAIINHFESYLDYETMAQSVEDLNNYKNKYNVQFFHDFTKYKSLKKQLPQIQCKYNRRIERFYRAIKEPTLFIRCINDEKGEQELAYWNKNIEGFINVLKSFNINNSVIFFANSKIKENYDNLVIYYFDEKQENLCAKMEQVLLEVEYPVKRRADNIRCYENKLKRKDEERKQSSKLIYRICEKIYCWTHIARRHKRSY